MFLFVLSILQYLLPKFQMFMAFIIWMCLNMGCTSKMDQHCNRRRGKEITARKTSGGFFGVLFPDTATILLDMVCGCVSHMSIYVNISIRSVHEKLDPQFPLVIVISNPMTSSTLIYSSIYLKLLLIPDSYITI